VGLVLRVERRGAQTVELRVNKLKEKHVTIDSILRVQDSRQSLEGISVIKYANF
jgi:hypothetical protein